MVTVYHSIQIPFMTLLLMQDKTENLTETMVEMGFNLRNYSTSKKKVQLFLDNWYLLSHMFWWSQKKDQSSEA